MTAIPEIPFGAIENGRVFLQRLADHYDFNCEAGSLANCTDYHEAVRCFEFIAQWISGLTAVLPFLQGVKVKELEWTNGVVDIAQPQPGMKYVACSTTPNGSWAWWLDNAPETRGVFLSEEAAKAAAQADYEDRIRSAIEPAPSPRELALEEAARLIETHAYTVSNAGPRLEQSKRAKDDQHHATIAAAIRALSSPDHADAGKSVEGDGCIGEWKEIEVSHPLKGRRQTPAYFPATGETCEVSGPNCDDDDGFTWGKTTVLWQNHLFVLYGNDGYWPVLHKHEHVLFRPLPSAPASEGAE